MGFYLSLFFILLVSLLITSNEFLVKKENKENFLFTVVSIFFYLSITYVFLRVTCVFLIKENVNYFDLAFCTSLFLISIALSIFILIEIISYILNKNKKEIMNFNINYFEKQDDNLELKEFNNIRNYINISLFNLENKKQFNKLKKEVLKLEDSILDTYKCNSKSSKKTYNNNLKVYKEVSLMLIHKDLLNENKIKNIINFITKNKIDYK